MDVQGDLRVRLAAFEWLRRQVEVHGDVLPRSRVDRPIRAASKAATSGSFGLHSWQGIRGRPGSLRSDVREHLFCFD